jgi:hypothetical protein
MIQQAFIFNKPGETEYRVIVKTDGKRTGDRRFNGESQRQAAAATLAFLESSGITERFVCDTRHFNADDI